MKYTKIILLAVAVLILIFAWNHFYGDISFESRLWQLEQVDNKRLRMVKDLVSRYKLVGFSREELHKLLGSPNTDAIKRFPGCDEVYYLGVRETLMDDDPAWLCIKLKEDKVTDIQVVYGY